MIWTYSQVGLQISIGWLVGNAVFAETALRILLIFSMNLGDTKVEKSQGRIFEKNSDLEIFLKRSPN